VTSEIFADIPRAPQGGAGAPGAPDLTVPAHADARSIARRDMLSPNGIGHNTS
jgi:hypothetical protein